MLPHTGRGQQATLGWAEMCWEQRLGNCTWGDGAGLGGGLPGQGGAGSTGAVWPGGPISATQRGNHFPRSERPGQALPPWHSRPAATSAWHPSPSKLAGPALASPPSGPLGTIQLHGPQGTGPPPPGWQRQRPSPAHRAPLGTHWHPLSSATRSTCLSPSPGSAGSAFPTPLGSSGHPAPLSGVAPAWGSTPPDSPPPAQGGCVCVCSERALTAGPG